MLTPIVNFVDLIHRNVGDLGLTFFLMIIVINLCGVWWIVPKKVQVEIQANPAKKKNLLCAFNLYRIIVLSVAELFLLGVIFASDPVWWLKLLSGILSVTVFSALLMFITRLLLKQFN